MEQKTISVNEILEQVENTPLFSKSATQLMQVVGEPGHDFDEIVKIVECDAELTAQLLRRVNSASFGLVTKVTSVARAVTYLGERLVVTIALSVCSSELFGQKLEGYECGENSLWEHSLKTAIASREIVLAGGVQTSPDVAFTAGLLHDLGKSVISNFMVGQASPILEKIDARNFTDFLEGEKAVLGIDHCAVGEALAERWDLPDVLVPPMVYHHHPDEAEEEDRPLVYAVHLGDMIAMLGGSGTGADSLGYGIHPEYTNYVKIEGDAIGEIMLNVMTEFSKTMHMFS